MIIQPRTPDHYWCHAGSPLAKTKKTYVLKALRDGFHACSSLKDLEYDCGLNFFAHDVIRSETPDVPVDLDRLLKLAEENFPGAAIGKFPKPMELVIDFPEFLQKPPVEGPDPLDAPDAKRDLPDQVFGRLVSTLPEELRWSYVLKVKALLEDPRTQYDLGCPATGAPRSAIREPREPVGGALPLTPPRRSA